MLLQSKMVQTLLDALRLMNSERPRSFMYILMFALLTGCGQQHTTSHDTIISMQLVDRHGFSETISNKERLTPYQGVDFLAPQPYQKVLRVLSRDKQGKSPSEITSYHSNGQPWQYLQAIDGRAHGLYREWHENGCLRIEASLIEGMADLSISAQASWVFEGLCRVWDDEGKLQAEFSYEKGLLHGDARYYHDSGKLSAQIPYEKGEIQGVVSYYDEEGALIEQIPYLRGMKQGTALGTWKGVFEQHLNEQLPLKYIENYAQGKLRSGSYYSPAGELLSKIENGEGKQILFAQTTPHLVIEHHKGEPEGVVETFDQSGQLISSSEWKEGKKEGEEWEYYPNHAPKLLVNWHEDSIQGVVKTWYENGILESQREMSGNKRQGLCFGYYQTGDLMFMEEYEADKLVNGSYYSLGEKSPVSKVEQGAGVATLYSCDGRLLKKISYDRGQPLLD